MDYYTKHILLRTGDSQSTLQSVVNELSVRLDRGQMGEYKVTKIDCPEGTIVVGPDDGEIPLRPVTHIHVTAGLTSTKTLIKGDTQFDQSLLVPNIEVTDLMTGEQRTFNPAEVGLGVNTVLEPGKFYENPWLGMFYQCASIRGNVAEFHLVEWFQLGELLCATFTQDVKYSFYFVPVSDPKVTARLQRRLEKYLQHPRAPVRWRAANRHFSQAEVVSAVP